MRPLLAVAGRPSLWSTAIRQGRRLAPKGWWRRPPFLPVPTKEYMEFRTITQYGETRRPPSADDVLDYLAWCREWDRSLQ
jgi:hypothetical protein